MQAAGNSVDFKDKAIHSLRRVGAFDFCPSLSRESIDHSDASHLCLSIDANTIRDADKPDVLQTNIGCLAEYVAAALRLLGDDTPERDDARSVTSTTGVKALSSEVIMFRAKVNREDGVLHVIYAATVKRSKVRLVVARGTRRILLKESSSAAPLPRPSGEPSSSSNPPPPQRQGSGKRQAPSNPVPPLKRVTPSSAAPSEPRRNVHIDADSLWNIETLRDFYAPLPQQFVYINCGAKRPDDCEGLKNQLANIGVSATQVTYTPLFLNFRYNYVFFFDVSSGDEERKVEEKCFKEEDWTRIFSVSELAKNKPFFAKNMRISEIFQSMLLATRLQGTPNPPHRRQIVWNRSEVEKSLKDDDVMKKVMEKLNTSGLTLLSRYERAIGVRRRQ